MLGTIAIQGGLSSGFLNVVFKKIGNIPRKRDELNAQDNTVEANQRSFYKTRPLWPACAECKGILRGRNELMYINSKTMSNQQIPLGQLITARLTFLTHAVRMRPNYQGLPWFEFDGFSEDELLVRFC